MFYDEGLASRGSVAADHRPLLTGMHKPSLSKIRKRLRSRLAVDRAQWQAEERTGGEMPASCLPRKPCAETVGRAQFVTREARDRSIGRAEPPLAVVARLDQMPFAR